MPETEFQQFQRYAARRLLPMRRIEMHLAQLSMLVATCCGGAQNVTLSDYLFDREEAPDGEGDDLQQAVEFFDFKPHRKT